MSESKLNRPISLINVEFNNSFNKSKKVKDREVKKAIKQANKEQIKNL